MSSENGQFPVKGFVILVVILLIVSIVAFLLSSIESFLAGVVVIFIGFLLSFFRDDIKQAVGYRKESEAHESEKVTEDDLLEKLEKKVAKGRSGLAKLVAKYEAKPKKQEKIRAEIIEEATALLALIDSAKAQAHREGNESLVQHYEGVAQEIRTIRARFEARNAGIVSGGPGAI